MENDPPAEGPLICAECGLGTDIGSGGADSAIRRWRPRPLSSTITVDEVVVWVASPAETMKPGTLDPNPARDPRVKLPKRVREEPTRPPAEHVLAILNEIHDPLRRIMFITLEQGALRLGEAVHLRWGDVDRAGLRLRLPRSATKRDQARCVYLPEWLMEAIEETCPLEDRTPGDGCSRGSRRRPRTRRCSGPARPPASPTTTRTTYVIAGSRSGISPASRLASWAERAGHSRPSMSLDVYSHVMPADEIAGDRPRQERAVPEPKQRSSRPGFVVLRQVREGHWKLLGEFERKGGLTARAARSQAILDGTPGKAKAGEVYAAVLRSEWRVALDWLPPTNRSAIR